MDFDATPFAANVPVYVRAADDAYELVDTATDATLDTFTKLREALDAALEHGIGVKAPVLRDAAGEPNGEWRWFPAAAEELEPNATDGFRMRAVNLWQMAAELNAATQPVPIDGGPQPEGMRPSEVHGTAHDSATPANGWAHAGVIYVDAGGSQALVLRGEVLPEIAPEVDRGRLAFGSVHFTHSELDANGEAERVSLKSFALTNRPVDKQLPAASTMRACRSNNETSRVLTRSRRLQMPGKNEKSRGAAMDAFVKIAGMVGVDPVEDLDDEAYCSKVIDAVHTARQAAQQERVVDQINGGGTTPTEVETQSEETRAVEGLEGASLESFASDAIALFREVLGKPEATPADLLTEAQASKDQMTAAIKAAPAEEDGMPPNTTQTTETQSEEARALRAELAQEKARANAEKARADKLAREQDEAKTRAKASADAEKLRAETEAFVRGEIKKRGLEADEERVARLTSTGLKAGRDAVVELLELQRGEPPSEELLPGGRPGGMPNGKPRRDEARYVAQRAAIDEAEKELRADLERRGKKVPANIRAVATERAAKRNPQAFSTRAVNTRA